MAAKLSITSVNARGLNNTKKRISLVNWITDNGIDVTFVQETFCTNNFVFTFNWHWAGEIYHSNTDSRHARGVCIVIGKNFDCKMI